MSKIYELHNITATCKSGDKIVAELKGCKWRFDFEGCTEARLAKDAAGNGWVVKAQSMFRAAIMATRKEDYAGDTIEQLKADWQEREFVILEDFKERQASDPVAAMSAKIEKLSSEQRKALKALLNQ
jgi:hypothetical protein